MTVRWNFRFPLAALKSPSKSILAVSEYYLQKCFLYLWVKKIAVMGAVANFSQKKCCRCIDI